MKGVVAACSILAVAHTVVFATQPPALQTPDFSAEIVTHDASGAVVNGAARLYVSRGKVRIDPPSSAMDYFLVDTKSTNALFVRPAQHIYMDARQSGRLTQLFLPSDPNHPCDLWQIAARHAGTQSVQDKWSCERVSAGRNVGYIVGSTPENSTQRWIDPELSFPVKVRTADGTTLELQHIKKEPQPAELFAVPSGYQKTDPHRPGRPVKPGGVWVTPGN